MLEYEEKLQEIFRAFQAGSFLSFLKESPDVIFIQSWHRMNLIPNDPDDNKFADCAFACNAHFLVSNDKHLLQLNNLEFPVFNVLKAAEFLKVLEDINAD